MECSICFERLHSQPTVILPCDHLFHEDCIIKWAQRSPTCPHCRAEFWFPPPHAVEFEFPWWFWIILLYGFWVYVSLVVK